MSSVALAHAPLWTEPEKITAFVLGSMPLGEFDRMLWLLDERGTLRRVVARGAQSLRHPWTEHFLTWARIEAALDVSLQRALPVVELSCLLRSPYEIYRRPGAGEMLLHLANAARFLAHENLEKPALFRLFAGLTEAAERPGTDAAAPALLLYAGLWGLRLEGLMPSLKVCAACRGEFGAAGALWRRRAQALVCPRCGGGRRTFSGESLRWIRACMRRGPMEVAADGAPPAQALREAALWIEAMFSDTIDIRFGWPSRCRELAPRGEKA
jgi:recombinational DNA repair protein (RecF pathway)